MATGVTSKELKDYFERAQSWDAREADRARKSMRFAYMLAAAGVAVGLCAVGMYLLSPLKIVEPYVVRVNETLGAVDVVSVATDTEIITGEEAVQKYFLAEYVRNREAWLPRASEELYKKTLAMTSTAEIGDLRAERDPSSPRSPARLYRNGERVFVNVRSVSFISDGVGQVRFSKIIEGGGTNEVRSDWLATVEYEFADEPTNDATRFYNPLGFVVTSYRVDSELGGRDL